MERINLHNIEEEDRASKSITSQLRLQFESKRDTAIAEIAKFEHLAHNAQDTLEALSTVQQPPHIIMRINYLDVEYDKYTYSESIIHSKEYVALTDNIEEAIELCVRQFNSQQDVELAGISIETASDESEYINLEDITPWRQLFMRRRKENK
jgi:hypothetical protein